MTATIKLIPKAGIADIWPLINEWVINAIGMDKTVIPEDIKNDCIAGRYELRLIYTYELKGFLISVIYETRRTKACYAPWLGGKDLEDWVKPAFDKFKLHLKEQGVKQYTFIGRQAWKRLIQADYEGIFYLINL